MVSWYSELCLDLGRLILGSTYDSVVRCFFREYLDDTLATESP